MRAAENWKDYELIDTSCGERLERWGTVTLIRPDPQIIWETEKRDPRWKNADARYVRSRSGGGHWEMNRPVPESWAIRYGKLTFRLKTMGFKHTGLFPEQAVNWDAMRAIISERLKACPDKKIKVLNLFAYTGGATVACAKAGAEVTHVDAAKGMVERAGENARLSGISSGIRYIIDDCAKFVAREIRRGNKYDAVIMDPPSYGRGPGGEMWKIEDDLFDFVGLCTKVLCPQPLFFLINSYTTGLQPCVINNILTLTLKDFEGSVSSYEVGIPTDEGIPLPCGASGLFVGR